MTCPCCGAETVISAWEHALGRLTTAERRTAEIIARRPGMGGDELAGAIYAHDPNGGPDSATEIARVIASKASRKLRPFGFVIKGHKSLGYRVVKVAT